MSRTRIALIVLFFASFLAAPTPAQAASTVLCTGYTSCQGQGYSHAGYATAKDTAYWNMYTGTNCTNYVAYRLVTTNGMPNKRPKAGVGNARDWGTTMASITNSTPTVGAVAWWGKNGMNHVAYIERVVSASEIWVSESNWSGAFDWRKITKTGGGWPDGIIHFADVPGAPSAPSTLTPTTLPSVSGTLRYGGTLTAAAGVWSATPSSLGYQWILDGVDVAGETSTTFKPRTGDVGKTVSVRVRAAKNGYVAAFATSVPTAPLGAAPVSVSVKPVVSGTAQVGRPLTASAGTWSRTGLSFAYQWLADGVAIEGATGTTFSPRSPDQGRTIAVEVTGTREGFATTTSRSAATTPIAAGVLTARSAPSISGTPRVGSRLTASPGTWSPVATATYQWYADNQAIAGATDQTFIPGYRQRGAEVRVRITARRPGYTSATAMSPTTAAVATGQVRVAKPPAIVGKAVVGTRLTAAPAAVSPDGAAARYQWLRDGKPIPRATGRSRRVSTADLGHRLSVRVTFKATGYSTRVVTSPQLPRVKSAPKLSIKVTKPAAGTATFSITVSAPRVAAPRGSITVRPAVGRARTARVSGGRVTLTLAGLPAGAQTFRVSYRGTSSVASVTVDKAATVR